MGAPGQCRQSRVHDVFDQGGDGLLARSRTASLVGEPHAVEAASDSFDDVAALLVEHDHRFDDHVGSEHLLDGCFVDSRGQADARVLSIAVEIGGDHEWFGRHGVGRSAPRCRSVSHLELSGLPAHGETIGIGEEENGAGTIGFDARPVESGVGAPGQIIGPVSPASDCTPIGAIVAHVAAGDLQSQCDVDRHVVGSTTHHVAIVEQSGDGAGECPVVSGRFSDHVGETRMHRNVDESSSTVGESTLGVEGAEHVEQFTRLLQRGGRWRVDERQFVERCSPRESFENETAQVDLRDLGRQLCAASSMFEFAPAAIRHAGAESSGAASPLIGRRT